MNAFPAALPKARSRSRHRLGRDRPREVRRHIRAGDYRGHTSGLARGYVQANLAILPRDYADEFLRFCQHTPSPAHCWRYLSPATLAYRDLRRTSILGPTFRATGCSETANMTAMS